MSSWIKIFSTDDPFQVEMIQSRLEENGVVVVQMNKRDSAYNTFGSYDLYCSAEDALLAQTLIRDLNL